MSEKRQVLRALADSKAKDVAPKAGALRVDWATWLVSDMQDEGSDNDVDSKDIEEEEEEEMSDDDLCGVKVDHAQTVFELCADVLRAQVFVVHQEQEGKMLKDKIVTWNAALGMTLREDLAMHT